MNQERAELLINRAVDGIATRDEREQLARAMRADPLLRSEFEELQTVHASTESLFRQLSLPEDFSKRVMRRVQGADVPADESLENVRLPSQRRTSKIPTPVTPAQRRRVGVYAIIATVSAAAAVMLAIGVLSGFFARAGIGTSGAETVIPNNEKEVADGRRGGPDTGEINRTVSPTHQPLANSGDGSANKTDGADPKVEQPKVTPPAPQQPKGSEDVQPNDEPQPEDVVKKPEGEQPGPVVPKPEPEKPEGGGLIDNGKPDTGEVKPEPEQKPEGIVETEPKKENATQVTPAPERTKLGKVAGILSGRVEVSTDNENWTRLSESQEIRQGDHIRTSQGGNALLLLDSGSVTLGHDTQVAISNASSVALEDGIVSLDRDSNHTGDLDVVVDDYTVHVSFGCALIERKRRGLSVAKSVGFASLSHDEFGSVLLDTDSGYEIEAEFGKVADEARKKIFKLPDWSSEARSQIVMMNLDSTLTTREFGVRERSYVTSRMPGGVEKLVALPTTTESVSAFLKDVINNDKLNGAAIIKVLGEVQLAYNEVTELEPDVINGHAGRAALVAKDYDQWREYFWRLMRPPVEPKKQPTSTTTETECPNANKDKLKRVDNPPRKPIVKKVPVPTPDKSEEEEPSNKN